MKKICFAFLCLLFGSAYSSELEEKTGSLIVSYRTDNKGERLDRTRFWLKKEDGAFREFYPKGESFVDNPEEHSRMVVIEALNPGTYTLQFLIPNRDHYFQETPERNVTVVAGEIVRFDQAIRPFSSAQNEAKNSNLNHLSFNSEISLNSKEVEMHEELGTLKLYVNVSWAFGEIVNREIQEESMPLELTGKETTISLPPGEYVLLFYETEKNNQLPQPINFKIESLQIKELNAYFAPRG